MAKPRATGKAAVSGLWEGAQAAESTKQDSASSQKLQREDPESLLISSEGTMGASKRGALHLPPRLESPESVHQP